MNLEENTEQSLLTLIFSSLAIELALFTILAKKFNSNLVSIYTQQYNTSSVKTRCCYLFVFF